MNKFIPILFFFLYNNIQSQIFSDSLITSFINEWVGVPYKWGGSSKKGIDCSQLNKKFYQEVYNISICNTCREQFLKAKRISFQNLSQGDLLFFHSRSSPSGWHCGIYLGDSKFIHASSRKTGVIISNIKDKDYRMRFRSGGRI